MFDFQLRIWRVVVLWRTQSWCIMMILSILNKCIRNRLTRPNVRVSLNSLQREPLPRSGTHISWVHVNNVHVKFVSSDFEVGSIPNRQRALITCACWLLSGIGLGVSRISCDFLVNRDARLPSALAWNIELTLREGNFRGPLETFSSYATPGVLTFTKRK